MNGDKIKCYIYTRVSTALQVDGYALENGELVIAEDEADIIRMIFDRYINTDDGINGVANYLNNHGYTKKIRQNGTIPGFSTSFVKKIIDNPVYMGKIAYGRRRTEKKNGTRNETHVVEQSEYPIYEGIHEAIISEEEWNLTQEKRSKNNYRREKVNDPDHAHILSWILRCPCCGKGMYGNVAKAHSKDNKTRYKYDLCIDRIDVVGGYCNLFFDHSEYVKKVLTSFQQDNHGVMKTGDCTWWDWQKILLLRDVIYWGYNVLKKCNTRRVVMKKRMIELIKADKSTDNYTGAVF